MTKEKPKAKAKKKRLDKAERPAAPGSTLVPLPSTPKETSKDIDAMRKGLSSRFPGLFK